MKTIFVATHQEGFTYTDFSVDIKDDDVATTIADLLTQQGYTTEICEPGDSPTYYQAPDETLPTGPEQHLDVCDAILSNLHREFDATTPLHYRDEEPF